VRIELRETIASLVELSTATDNVALDLIPFLQTLRRKCQSIENAFVEHGKLASNKVPVLPVFVQGEREAASQAFTFSLAIEFVDKEFDKLSDQLSAVHRSKSSKMLRELRDSLTESIQDFRNRKEVHERRIVCAAASAILWLGDLGNKLNPIIQGIMNAVKVKHFRMSLIVE
jgi:TATA-binding protein-associated factor